MKADDDSIVRGVIFIFEEDYEDDGELSTAVGAMRGITKYVLPVLGDPAEFLKQIKAGEDDGLPLYQKGGGF